MSNLQWREVPSFPEGFIRDSGSCDGKFRTTQERSSRQWDLHFPLLSSGLPPAPSWNILEYSALDKPEEQQETAQGRRWLWLFHLSRAGFGDGKWLFWHLGRTNWLWSFAGKASSPGGIGIRVSPWPHGVPTASIPCPKLCISDPEVPPVLLIKGRDGFKEPGVRSHFPAIVPRAFSTPAPQPS